MRIILADHHSKALWALVTTLVEEPDIELCGAVADGLQLLDYAATIAVDLVLVDRHLPGVPIQTLIASLHELNPRLIVVAMSSDQEDGRMLLKAGADAFISKGDQPDWLLETLRQYASRIHESGRQG
jgi:DNA-binding NarL/FixJ family response regulator